MNRNRRAQLGNETVAIAQQGWYETAAGRVDIAKQLQSCVENTALFTPADLDELVDAIPQGSRQTKIEVPNETTLSAARRLVVDGGHANTLCLNFASAKKPGGGFLSGAQAQEESLARASALYASLITQTGYYETNRGCGTALYTDHMILSPDVPIFRDDDGDLLAEPYLLSIATAPAVNAGAVLKNEPDKQSMIRPAMAARIAKLLALAAHRGYEHLVLGAWGCGVFRNDPAEIARLFAEALLRDGPFAGRFSRVVFAVFTRDERIIEPFRTQFEGE